MEIKATKVLEWLLKTDKRIMVLQGGTRSSKTYSIAQWVLISCLQTTGKTYSIVRKAMPSLKKTVMRDFFEILNEHKIYNEKNHNKTDQIYTLNGNTIEFFSLDNAQKVRGATRHILWINEANEADLESYRQLMLRTKERAILDFNPSESEDHWLYTEVIDVRDDIDFNVSTYRDNPFLKAEQVKEIERFKLLDPSFWTVYGEGKRSDIQIGTVFNKAYYKEYEAVPADLRSVIYCDPNLAIKSKGDTTAIVNLGYSPTFDTYHVIDAFCESFADSNDLLNKVWVMRTPNTSGIAFDGHVSQESTWTNLVKAWGREKGQPFPRIEYKRYRTDDLAKNIQLAWNEGKVLFPSGFRASLASKLFLSQVFAFSGKKANQKDDAPDALICAFEFLHERQLTSKKAVTTFRQPDIRAALSF